MQRFERAKALVVALAAVITLGVPVFAQSSTDIVPENWAGGGAYYNLAAPNAVAIHVHVWGNLARSGIYQVPRGTRLSTLYTVAGGPTGAPMTPRERRTTTITVLRPNGTDYDEVFSSRFSNRLQPFTNDLELQTGDIVAVDTQVRQSLHWREILTTAGSVASSVILIDRLVNLARGRRVR